MTEETDQFEPFDFSLAYFIGIYFLMIWFGLFPTVLFGYWYFSSFPFSLDPIYLLLLIPLFFIFYGISLLSSLVSTKIAIWIVHKRLTYPTPGSYPMTMEDTHVRAWVIKGNLRNFARWLFYFFHLDFMRAFYLRRMGVKIGKNVKLGRHVLDDDFIEIGDNVFMAKECIISGHLMDQTNLTINPTVIGENCIFEAVTGTVGTLIGKNSIFKAGTMAMKGNNCRGDAIYQGLPIKKVGNYADLSADEIDELKNNIKKRDKIDYITKKNSAIKVNGTKLFFMKLTITIVACLFGLIFPLFYALWFRGAYNPNQHLLNILFLALIPIIFLISIGFFIVGEVLTVKLFLWYYNRKGEIKEGFYDLDDPLAKIFLIKYYLRKFGMRLFHGTPFRIGSSLALRVWGTTSIGLTNIKFEDAEVDPQYFEIENFSQVSAGARIHTHDIVDNKLYIKRVKLGVNVIVGAYAHISPGVELCDRCIVAVGAVIPQDQKYEKPVLLIGNPAKALPLSVLTKSARLEGRYIDDINYRRNR